MSIPSHTGIFRIRISPIPESKINYQLCCYQLTLSTCVQEGYITQFVSQSVSQSVSHTINNGSYVWQLPED